MRPGFINSTICSPALTRVAETQPSDYIDGLDAAGSAGGVAHNPGDLITAITLGRRRQWPRTTTSANCCPPASAATSMTTPTTTACSMSAKRASAVLRSNCWTPKAPTGLTATTDVYGYYEFDTVTPGTYSLAEIQPDGYFDGLDAAGTVGGVAHNPGDLIDAMALACGRQRHCTTTSANCCRPASAAGSSPTWTWTTASSTRASRSWPA